MPMPSTRRVAAPISLVLLVVVCLLPLTPGTSVHSAAQQAAFTGKPMETIQVPIAAGPVRPNWKSLGDNFKTPSWWRQAKIGMWLHWGPQSVAEEGDWYAKWMYLPRYAWPGYQTVYKDHLARYGHPSISGYKDMLPLWKAERWKPGELMALYRRAGARYVIAQGMHHDNFDLWDSKYQPWNSVAIGPHRSIVGDWKKAADAEGMRFGIAFHGDYSLWWYQPAFLSDLDGPMAGVPYDGAQTYTGKDTWWQKQGLKLRDLYGIDLKDEAVMPAAWPPSDVADHTPLPADPALALTAYRMSEPLKQGVPDGDLRHHRDFAIEYATKWTHRVLDAIDQFNPDFIYFDGGNSYPFCGYGTGKGLRADATPRVIADLYNRSIALHGGKLEAMAFTKGNEDPRAVAVNVESRTPEGIKRDQPWQTENGLGEWFYRKGTFYDSGMVIHEMLEAVSRDGNYAINIPLTPAGELDPGGRKTLQDMGKWMDRNSEGIYGSNAWDVWGEGSVIMKRGNLGSEQAGTPYTSQDIRYTAKGNRLYAYMMAWPIGPTPTVTLHSLRDAHVTQVDLLGGPQNLPFSSNGDGLTVKLPLSAAGSFAFGLRITGEQLHATP